MSNGGRCNSASPATKNTTMPGNCHNSHHGSHASTMPGSDRVPAAIATLEAARTNGSSYDISCTATRIPPSRLNLLALAQPPIKVPRTPTLVIASTKNSPMSRSWPTRPGPSGIAIIATRYGTSATPGAIAKTVRSAAAGAMSSFWANLTPSATSCAQPWKRPAYIGPTRACMWAMALCSVWPTSSGSRRKAASTAAQRRATSNASAIAAAFVRNRVTGAPLVRIRDAGRRDPTTGRGLGGVGLARLLRPRPRLDHPRHEHEVLAERMALEAVGQQQRIARTAHELDAEHLVGLPLVPGRSAVQVDQRVD